MNVVILFINIGFYHAARLQATAKLFNKLGWSLTAVQLTNNTLEHPWGSSDSLITFPLITLESSRGKNLNKLPKITGKDINLCLTNLHPNVVFIPGWAFSISKQALQWCHQNKINAIVMSESKYDDKQRFWLKEKIKSLFYVRKFSAALVGGEMHAKYLEYLGIPSVDIHKGYDAVDNDYFTRSTNLIRRDHLKARKLIPSIPSRPYFLVVTRLIPRKNISRLIDAYILYKKEIGISSWDLVICGEGEEMNKLKLKIGNGRMNESIHFPGFVPYHHIVYWYAFANALVHPALNEQWGLVINEACASGLPIVCSETVGARHELVKDGINGYLFSPSSVKNIFNSLVRLHLTPDVERSKMGKQSRILVKNHSPENFAKGVVDCILGVSTKI